MTYVCNETNAYKFAELARNVFGITETNDLLAAKLGIDAYRKFLLLCEMPTTLSEIGITAHFDEMADGAIQYGEIGSIKKLNKEDVVNILNLSK